VKLEKFLESDNASTIPEIQLALLDIQLPIMKSYLECLQIRIDHLN
jgi:hypothetical protein